MKIIKGNLTNNLKEAILHGLKDHDIAKYGTSGILDPISFYIKNQEKEIISAIVCQPERSILSMCGPITKTERRDIHQD